MAFDTLRSIFASPAVHAKPDASRANPEGQRRRDSKARRGREKEEVAHPVPNDQGQMTGKLIDTTA